MPTTYKLRIGNGDGGGVVSDSACCECAKQLDACTCSDFDLDIECSTRGGTCTLCGWSEYGWTEAAGHSAKKYLTRTLAGSLAYADNDDPFASPDVKWSGTISYSGSSTWTPSATTPLCSLTSRGTVTRTRTRDCSSCGACTMDNSVLDADEVGAFCGHEDDVITLTSKSRPHDGGTVQIGTFGSSLPFFSHDASGGTLTETLSAEDTESDAIDRMRTVNDWSSYAVCRDSTHTSDYCCTASWQARSGLVFDFIYNEAKYRLTKTGLPPATTMTLTLEFWRKPYGADPSEYVLFSTDTQSAATASDGSIVIDGDMPIERGYDTSLKVASLS
jgi:hypothetical protein